MFRMLFKSFLVRCRDQVLPGFTAVCLGKKGGPRRGALGGSGAVPALSCHPWHKQLVPGLWTSLCRGLRAPRERPCGVSLQDYELFVEAVEQNTLQEFLKLA